MQPRRKAAIWSNDLETAASRRPGAQPQQVRWTCRRCWGRVLPAARQSSLRPGGQLLHTHLDVCTATMGMQDTSRRRQQILLMSGCRRSPGSQRLCRQPAMTRMTSYMRICQLPNSRRQVT
jgi:hypothetical protein